MKKIINNRNGFTLIELLVVIVILGIITGFSIPLIRNIEKSNQISKFNTFKESLINGAKLYVDSYGEDDISSDPGSCYDITFPALKNKKLVKDFPDNNINCNNESTYVRVVVGSDGRYKYETNISCESERTSYSIYNDAKDISDTNANCEKIDN